MASKRKVYPTDPFVELENRLKDYVAEIYTLNQINAERNRTISELRHEVFQLKKEIEALRNQGYQGSVIIGGGDESTQVLERNHYGIDDQSTQIPDKQSNPGFEDDSTQIPGNPLGEDPDEASTQFIR